MKVYKHIDEAYKDLVEEIENNGEWITENVRTIYVDETPATYKSIIGYQFRLDNSKDIAQIITTRKAPYKNALKELWWIWFQQSNKVQYLKDIGCPYWNEFELEDGSIGLAYGYQIAQPVLKYKNQLEFVIEELKHNPSSRRIMTEIWVPQDLIFMSLTPCVHLTQWSVINNKLYLEVRQRSCDTALGLVSNVFQYSILHKLIAKECNLEPAEIIWNIHNAHIYDRHYDELIKQIKKETFKPAKVIIPDFKSIYDLSFDDIKVEDYKSGKAIKYEIAI